MRAGVILSIAMVAVSAPGLAQDPVLALNPTTMMGYSGTVAADQYARRDFGTRIRSRPTATRGPDPAAARARLSFTPNEAVRQKVYARAVAQLQRVDPEDAVKLRQRLQSGMLARDVGKYLGRYGMSISNVADTTALYLAIAWGVAHGITDDPARGQMIGLRNQVAATFASMPSLARASDAAKQSLSEETVIQIAYASSFANAMDHDHAFASRASAMMVKSVMASYGLDLSRLRLTGNGLR